MSRIFTSGFEVGSPATFTMAGEDSSISIQTATGTFAFDNTIKRSGAQSLKMTTATTPTVCWLYFSWVVTAGHTYYNRIAVNISTHANVVHTICALYDGVGAKGLELQINSDGTSFTANFSTDVSNGITGPTFNTNQWYVIELAYTPGTGASELRVDGRSYGTTTAETTTGTSFRTSLYAGAGRVVNFDDWALNDNFLGGSWCGLGKVVMLLPTADSARTGYTTGAGGTTSLWDAVNNVPPTGTTSPGTATSQIGDTANNTTDNYQPALQTYSAAGIASTDTILFVQAMINHGSSAATAMSSGISGVSNPVISESTASTAAAIAGTFPTNWITLKTATVANPVVNVNTAPVLEVRKNTASTTVKTNVDFMGMYVEYITPTATSRTRTLLGVGV